ncbi:hypothetical protein QA645_32045 [Bradyrhizobium sp. CIAT3101]|uniref:hypothetical protein n=1 Tax=Bradyrhizobium sp. CIAT3101 TaxID=439387 RepID=UPI0024B1E794|nr:hypothetical protein [Bradyrhizobium sp. CIAT3101]WFU79128.1 hypothetical protein QA645_32045 [Bradyrhizobium sp. CIAT3101]
MRCGVLLCLTFIGIHLCLFLFDIGDPTAFIRGDRASERLDHVNQLLAARPSEVSSIVLNSGVPGDFLQHWALYAIGGRKLVILCQIGLELVTIMLIYLFVVRVSASAKIATVAAMMIILMPGSLLNPHLLVTETWFVAFLVAGTICVCLSVGPSREVLSQARLFIGFACLGLASFIRPQGLLIPLSLATLLATCIPSARRTAPLAALLSYAIFPISWMTLRFLLVGDFGLGPSNADLQTNLALRADRILSLPLDSTGRLGLLPFLQLAADHPRSLLNTFYTDAFNLILNPGANHLFGNYLGLGETPDGFSWLKTRDQFGIAGVIAELLRRNGTLVALFAVWTVIHAVVLFGVGRAGVMISQAGRRTPMWMWIMIIVIATTLLSAFAAGLVRWNLRSGVEPLLAVLAAYGLLSERPQAQLTVRGKAGDLH